MPGKSKKPAKPVKFLSGDNPQIPKGDGMGMKAFCRPCRGLYISSSNTH